LRVSSSLPADPNSAHYIWYQRFAEGVSRLADIKLELQYFPNSQLGKEADVVQQVKVGSIDMMLTGSSIWATVAPELGMLDLGYLFDSYAQVFKTLDGGVGDKLSRIVQDRTRCTVLAWGSHFGSRSVYTKNPVRNLAQVKGVKLRVLPTTAFIDTFKLIGAIPTPIPFNELYTALQTGVVDGFEHDPSTVLSTKLYEVSKHCWLTEHLFPPMVAVIGKRGWDKLPAATRPALAKAAADATAFQRAQAVEHGKQAIEELKRLGIEYHPMLKSEREQVRTEMQAKLWSAFAAQYPLTKPLFEAVAASRA
jgi:tripartite ATP-independent transporter DctP family solute receptor